MTRRDESGRIDARRPAAAWLQTSRAPVRWPSGPWPVAGGSCRRTRPQTPQAPSEGRVPPPPARTPSLPGRAPASTSRSASVYSLRDRSSCAGPVRAALRPSDAAAVVCLRIGEPPGSLAVSSHDDTPPLETTARDHRCASDPPGCCLHVPRRHRRPRAPGTQSRSWRRDRPLAEDAAAARRKRPG